MAKKKTKSKRSRSKPKTEFALAFGSQKKPIIGKKRFKTKPAAIKAANKAKRRPQFIAKITTKR